MLSKEDSDDVKDGLPKHNRRNGKDKRFKNSYDKEKMSAQSLVGATDRDHKRLKWVFAQRVTRRQGAHLLRLTLLMRDGIC